MKKSYIFRLCGVALSLILWGCGGSTGGQAGGTGMLHVSLTDAAACGFDHVFVTVSKVRVHQSSSAGVNEMGWTDIDLPSPQKIDLTSLVNGVLQDLGQTALPAGHYTQLRLVLVPNTQSDPPNNSVIPSGGTEVPLATPSGVQTGLKLIHEFDVPADTMVDLVLDFDACHSIVKLGNGGYLLKPVISVTPEAVSGQITGFVDLTLSNPVVYAEQAGHVVKTTIPDGTTGSFILSPLEQSSTAGDYDVVITADGAATAMIQSVPVTAQTDTAVSTNIKPITLAASATHTVSGAITPSVEATIRATQTFTSGQTMEVRSTSATDSYSLTLPAGAPSLGTYGSLPIALTADGAVSGKYQLEASAEGYSTQTVPIDISGGDVTKDFALTP